jgi:DNA-binding HxlR family transcriptional regulator
MVSNKPNMIGSDCCKMRSEDGYCPKPLEAASGFLSKKWSISIITTIGNFRNLRFNDIESRVEGITAKILTERLKELEEKSILQRKEINGIPRGVEYSLTKEGLKLRNALVPLIHWAEHRKTELP